MLFHTVIYVLFLVSHAVAYSTRWNPDFPWDSVISTPASLEGTLSVETTTSSTSTTSTTSSQTTSSTSSSKTTISTSSSTSSSTSTKASTPQTSTSFSTPLIISTTSFSTSTATSQTTSTSIRTTSISSLISTNLETTSSASNTPFTSSFTDIIKSTSSTTNAKTIGTTFSSTNVPATTTSSITSTVLNTMSTTASFIISKETNSSGKVTSGPISTQTTTNPSDLTSDANLGFTTFTTTSCEGTITYTIVVTVTSCLTNTNNCGSKESSIVSSSSIVSIIPSTPAIITSRSISTSSNIINDENGSTAIFTSTKTFSTSIKSQIPHQSNTESEKVQTSTNTHKSTQKGLITETSDSDISTSSALKSVGVSYTTLTITTCDSQGSTYVTVTSYPRYYFSNKILETSTSTSAILSTWAGSLTSWKNSTSISAPRNSFSSDFTELTIWINKTSTSLETSSLKDCHIFTTTVYLWSNSTSVVAKFPSDASTTSPFRLLFIALIALIAVILT